MFDFDAGKLLVIGVVALIVIGPKELPRVLRQVGQAMGKLRRMAGEFQTQFMDAMKEAELEDLRKEATKLADATKLNVDFNPVDSLKTDLTSALEGKKDTSANSEPEDPAIAASLRDDPDGVFLPMQQSARSEQLPSSSLPDLPLPEPAPAASFAQIGEYAAHPSEAVILPEPMPKTDKPQLHANAEPKIEGKKEGMA